MKKLISLPAGLVKNFHRLENLNPEEYFCTNDPENFKLGSGGGTAHLLLDCKNHFCPDDDFNSWLESQKRILLHAGGRSSRLPAYAPVGKILSPIPVFRWCRGQNVFQNLLQLQLPLYEKILNSSGNKLHTLVASGDVLIRAPKPLPFIPEADIVCFGLFTDADTASHHGVFVCDRYNSGIPQYVLQKPSVETLQEITKHNIFLTDVGIWLFSTKAVDVLMRKCKSDNDFGVGFYDMYTSFGGALGYNPKIVDSEINNLSCAVVNIPEGEFYHFGTGKELISSSEAVQNIVTDRRNILHKKIKPHQAMFVQNSDVKIELTSKNYNLWIENSFIDESWQINNNHIITGIPEGVKTICLPSMICIDVIPYDDKQFIVRPYHILDNFSGSVNEQYTAYQGITLQSWAEQRNIFDLCCVDDCEIQAFALFPIVDKIEDISDVIRFMTIDCNYQKGRDLWINSKRISADGISARANLFRLYAQRESLQKQMLPALYNNFEKSVFFQSDLTDIADKYVKYNFDLPASLPETADPLQRIHAQMLKYRIGILKNHPDESFKNTAFGIMAQELTGEIAGQKMLPVFNLDQDRIVWGRSPVRIDLAGGWTDTPPYSLYNGGNVVNIAVELNGQPPIQVYVKPNKNYEIILRSIDLGAQEIVTNFDELRFFNKVGSPFSIAKAALALSGFLPEFSAHKVLSLKDLLLRFGSGIEITQSAALPAGSGMGTSSILAATLLGVLNKFASLHQNNYDICRKTLVLEQLLTTGGGWQDQYGGIFPGIKILSSQAGFNQQPDIRYMPDYIFSNPEYKACHLLYYTGITRTAKHILQEIVTNMFLNSAPHLRLLDEMKSHALDLYEMLQRNDFDSFGKLIKRSWTQNKALDSGVNPEGVEKIISIINDYASGYKLPGAGGGGYLYIVAKDPQAALRIRKILNDNPPCPGARFTEMQISHSGLQISMN